MELEFTAETWKEVVGYEDYYEVSCRGRIRSVNRTIEVRNKTKHQYRYKIGKILKQKIFHENRWYVNLNMIGKMATFPVHRLVAQAFIPNPENKPQVNHINGNPLDNRVENLEWCTQKENMKHAIDTGLNNTRGSNSFMAKFTYDEIKKMRQDFKENPISYTKYAKLKGLNVNTVSRIMREISYKPEWEEKTKINQEKSTEFLIQSNSTLNRMKSIKELKQEILNKAWSMPNVDIKRSPEFLKWLESLLMEHSLDIIRESQRISEETEYRNNIKEELNKLKNKL